MAKATDQLLKDHKMIRKILEQFALDNPRFPEVLATLHRVVVGHAWFEDEIFLPAFRGKPLLDQRFVDEIAQEHRDIDHLLIRLRSPGADPEPAALALQLRTLLETHFRKEEDAVFPLAERILDDAGLNRLGDEMERRKTDVRAVLPK